MAEHFRAEGLDALGPFPMERKRPDGSLLKWRLLIPGGTAWRRPWPFFIEWGMPDAERLQLERPGKHANGAQGVGGVTVAMRDLNRGKDLYGRQLGMTLSDEGDTGEVAWARYTVGQFRIDVVCPRMTDAVQEYFATYGEGLTQVWLATAAKRSAEEHLAQRKVAVEQVQGRGGLSGVRPAEGCGQNLVFTQ
jgi:hypothetical protein